MKWLSEMRVFKKQAHSVCVCVYAGEDGNYWGQLTLHL